MYIHHSHDQQWSNMTKQKKKSVRRPALSRVMCKEPTKALKRNLSIFPVVSRKPLTSKGSHLAPPPPRRTRCGDLLWLGDPRTTSPQRHLLQASILIHHTHPPTSKHPFASRLDY